MKWDDAQKAYWADVEAALREVHGPELLLKWEQDIDTFLTDMLEFCQGAYEGGYLDALDSVRASVMKLEREADA